MAPFLTATVTSRHAIERNTKLVLNFALGRRSQATGRLHRGTPPRDRTAALPNLHRWLPGLSERNPDYLERPLRVIKAYSNANPEGQRRYSPPDVPILIPASPIFADACKRREKTPIYP